MKKQFFFSSFLPRSTSFIGYARSPYDDATFRDHLRPYLESGGNAAGKSSKKGAGEATAAGAARGEGASTSTEAAAAAAEAAASKKKPSFSATSTGGKECVEAFLRQVSYVSGDYEGDEGWAKLGGAIAAAEAEAASKCSPSSSAAALSALKLEGGGEQQQHQQQHQHPRGRLIYLALPPNVYPLALRGVRAHCSHVGSGGGGGGNHKKLKNKGAVMRAKHSGTSTLTFATQISIHNKGHNAYRLLLSVRAWCLCESRYDEFLGMFIEHCQGGGGG